MKSKHNVVMLLALLLVLAVIVQGIEPQTNPERDPTAMRQDGTNADNPVFPGPVTVSGAFVASDTATIGTSTAAAGYDLTVASGAYLANVVATGTLAIPLVAPADPQPGMIWFEP